MKVVDKPILVTIVMFMNLNCKSGLKVVVRILNAIVTFSFLFCSQAFSDSTGVTESSLSTSASAAIALFFKNG